MESDAVFVDRASACAATVQNGNKRIRTQCYDNSAESRLGGAHYRESSASEVADYPTRGWFTSNGGTRYWLLDEPVPDAYMFGGVGDGDADDLVPLQQLLDFWCPAAQMAAGTVTSRPVAMSGGGPVYIPKGVWRHTKPLNQNAFVSVHGDGMAMFPQAPMDGATYGQYDFPNATILRPDFSLADRALGVGIQTSPYILTLSGASASLTGQTVGTRFQSLLTTHISGFDIDTGCINYCEGANIRDLTIWPVNEIFAGVRWTAGSKANIERVGTRNVKRGIFAESCWESNIQKCGIFDFKDYGVYGGGNLHAFGIRDNWIHGGGRVVAGDRPVGILASFFMGLEISANAVDDLWNAFILQSGSGAVINANHSERISNVYLTTNDAYGVRGCGNHIIQNVVDGRTFTDSLLWDGNDCEVDINIVANLTGTDGIGTIPGKTYLQGVNPNTGASTALVSATGNRTSVTFRGMQPLAGDAARVNRLSGNIRFIDDIGEWEIAGGSLGNQYVQIHDTKGDSGVKHVESHRINGAQTHYTESDTTGVRWVENSTGSQLLGFRYSDNALVYGGGLTIIPGFGSPNTFFDGPVGALCVDTANGKLYIKTSSPGTLTGWVVVGTQT